MKKHATPDGYNTELTLFCFHENKIKVFLLENDKGEYYLPGTFINKHETGRDAAIRNVHKYFTTDEVFLRHVAVFDMPERDFRGWIISNVFYGILRPSLMLEQAERFYNIDELRSMNIAFDHQEIIEKSILNIKKDLLETTVAKYFLNSEFSITELQKLLLCTGDYPEIIRTHFFTKIKSMRFISPVILPNGQQKTKITNGAKRPSKLFYFDETNYVSSIYF